MTWVEKISIADKGYLLLMLLILVIFISRYRSIKSTLRPLLAFVVVHFSLELGSDYMHYSLGRENLILYHLFTPVSYLILCVFFRGILISPLNKRQVLLSIPVYLLLVGLYTWLWEPITRTNSLAYMTESLLVIYFCFTFFRTVLAQGERYRPEYDPTFWITVAILFYFIGNFFIIGSLNYFGDIKRPDLVTKVYYAGYAFNYLLYIIIGVVLLIDFPGYIHEQHHH